MTRTIHPRFPKPFPSALFFNRIRAVFLLYCLDFYTHMQKHTIQIYPGTILLTAMLLSIVSPMAAKSCVEGEQDVLATAYYSPKPDQEHYALGSYEADIRFNGRGIEGNDGTPVYPGMIAAPAEVPFGTVIEFPDLGMVGTVHDRGGRINVTDEGIHHIDIWMGEGEEGLARALEWGARRVRSVFYHPRPDNIPRENFDLAQFPAPSSALAHVRTNPIALTGITDPKFGDISIEVAAIQYALQQLGYFDHNVTHFYGDVTKESVATFQRDADIEGNGDSANEKTRQILIAHRHLSKKLDHPTLGDGVLITGAEGKTVRTLQRVMNLIGYGDENIDGVYDHSLTTAVYEFQRDRGIVSSQNEAGAGMVGPDTSRALLTAWRDHRIMRRGGVETLVAAL
jgi:peptidoglycan hydrolase-like protein with peptidoglycan-binding domain